MFSSFKKAGEVQIRRTPALEPGAVVYLNTSSEIIGERFFHETEFRFVVVPRLLMRKICAETPPPPPTHPTQPNLHGWYPNMKQAVRDHKENKSGLLSRELALWNLIVPIEYIMWGLIKLLGVLSVRQINCTFGSASAELAPIAACKCRHWWSGDSWHHETRRRGRERERLWFFFPWMYNQFKRKVFFFFSSVLLWCTIIFQPHCNSALCICPSD